MSKPYMYRLYLVRHGQSEANANPQTYYEKYGHDLLLTDLGKEQSAACGQELRTIFEKTDVPEYSVFVSSYTRARETWDQMSLNMPKPKDCFVDSRLREQEHKDFKDEQEYNIKKAEAEQRTKLYYRWKNGESICDVIDRMSGFYNQLRMDLMLGNLPRENVIVSHDVALRCLLMVIENKVDRQDSHLPNAKPLILSAGGSLQFKYEEQ